MKAMEITWLLVPALTLCGPLLVHGHQGDRVYPILEITEEARIDLKDGVVDDWSELLGEPTFTALDFTAFEWIDPDAESTAYDPSSLDFRIWLGWGRNPSRLYVAGIFSDDVFVGPDSEFSTALGGRQDHMFLYVDGDHDGAPSFDTSDRVWGSDEDSGIFDMYAQWYHATSIPADGKNVSLPLLERWGDSPWWSYPPYGDGGGSATGENPVFWVVEFYVTPFDMLIRKEPESSVISDLFPGKTIGFQLEVWDFDDPESNRFSFDGAALFILGDYSGVTFKDTHFDADTWLDGILIGDESTGDPGSVVKSDSWARIKASFLD